MFLGIHKTQASQLIPTGKNYLSMSNIGVHQDDPYYASTIHPIHIEAQTLFTLVLSYEFIGQHTQAIDYLSITIKQTMSQQQTSYPLQDDYTHERVYIEFISSSPEIEIVNLPIAIDIEVYEAILYRGSYGDFQTFEPYLLSSDVISYEGVFMMNVDDLLDTNALLSLFTAKDPYGNLLNIFIEEDEYSTSDKLPGSYRLTLATTHNHITKHYHLNIYIYDITAPIMHFGETLVMPLTEKIAIEEIVSQVHLSDNVDTLDHDDIRIIEDTYSSANHVGNYYIKLAIKDKSNNESFLTIHIQLIDRQAPTAQFPKNVFLYNTDVPLTNEEILSKFSIIDDVDGSNVTTSWVINNYHQTQIPGIYSMTLSTKDSQNNESQHIIFIHVIDHKGPIFETNDLIITLDSHQTMTEDDIINWFYQQSSNLGLNVSHVRILYNEYELANQQSGNHYVYLAYHYQGEEYTSRILLQVKDSNSISTHIYYGIALAILLSGVGMYLIKKKKI